MKFIQPPMALRGFSCDKREPDFGAALRRELIVELVEGKQQARANVKWVMSSTDAAAPPAKRDSDHQPFRFNFENTYARLPERFYARVDPTPVRAPRLVKVNVELAGKLGLDPDTLASPEGVEILAGNRVAEGSEPLAMAYAGHQFGHFVPQLGDGRANLLGEVVGR